MRILYALLVLLCLQGCIVEDQDGCNNSIRQMMAFDDQKATVVEAKLTGGSTARIYRLTSGDEELFYMCEPTSSDMKLTALPKTEILKVPPPKETTAEKPAEAPAQL